MSEENLPPPLAPVLSGTGQQPQREQQQQEVGGTEELKRGINGYEQRSNVSRSASPKKAGPGPNRTPATRSPPTNEGSSNDNNGNGNGALWLSAENEWVTSQQPPLYCSDSDDGPPTQRAKLTQDLSVVEEEEEEEEEGNTLMQPLQGGSMMSQAIEEDSRSWPGTMERGSQAKNSSIRMRPIGTSKAAPEEDHREDEGPPREEPQEKEKGGRSKQNLSQGKGMLHHLALQQHDQDFSPTGKEHRPSALAETTTSPLWNCLHSTNELLDSIQSQMRGHPLRVKACAGALDRTISELESSLEQRREVKQQLQEKLKEMVEFWSS